MSFFAYSGLSDKQINKQYYTTMGNKYSLNHNEELKVEMKYIGKEKSTSNSQGWERNKEKYFRELYEKHPEMFSRRNVSLLNHHRSPVVDSTMIKYNPQWADYKNQKLIHHHIGGDGEAVAVPKGMHNGSGGIHNAEKELGITQKCKELSEKYSLDESALGKTHSEIRNESELGKKTEETASKKDKDENIRIQSVDKNEEKTEEKINENEDKDHTLTENEESVLKTESDSESDSENDGMNEVGEQETEEEMR